VGARDADVGALRNGAGGYWGRGWFLNCVVEGGTEKTAVELLALAAEIETRMGSKKLVAKGPRLMDMDILLYAQETMDTPELQVPHPRMHLRRFVLVAAVGDCAGRAASDFEKGG